MHDLAALEGQGLVAAFVASSEFVDAARAQATALGYAADGLPAVFVPHPIQDRTDDEMRVLAERALDATLAAVTADAR
ncbi:MAG: hypothetical protein GEV03_13330 [Streptosporangiales bacterium]|nr:hypothetical protein [Streptosporangiales bacterium]